MMELILSSILGLLIGSTLGMLVMCIVRVGDDDRW